MNNNAAPCNLYLSLCFTIHHASPLLVLIQFNSILSKQIKAPSVTPFCTTPWSVHAHMHNVHCTLHNVHQSTMWAPGVFYQTQRGETTCEMRHYIIGVTRSHADHHLHLDTTPSSLKSFTTLFKTPYFRYLQTIWLSMKCNTNHTSKKQIRLRILLFWLWNIWVKHFILKRNTRFWK